MRLPAQQAHARSARVFRVPCDTARLIAAINTANGLNAAVLRLAPLCTYSIQTPATANTGLPPITGNITLIGGARTTIRRDAAAPTSFRIAEVASGATLRVIRVNLRGGSIPMNGGAISNSGTLRLLRTTLLDNSATNGGAVSNEFGGDATISFSLIRDNNAGSVGGGGVLNFAKLTVL